MPLPTRRQGFPTGLLNKTATVYAATDDFVAPVKSGLACRLSHLGTAPTATAQDRAELAAMRRLSWDEPYNMPEGARVVIDGQKWNTVRGTFASPDAVVTGDVYHCCDVRPA